MDTSRIEEVKPPQYDGTPGSHGSSHSYQRALHCFADFLLSREATLAHWFLPYFMTAAFKISSSVFFQTPPLIMMRIFV